MQSRLKSKVLWVAMAALILFVLKNWGLLGFIGLTEDSYNQLTDLVFAVLVALGVINNPTDSEKL